LLNNTKIKTTEIKGKYFSPSLFILSNNSWDDISYIVSTKTCQVFGVKKPRCTYAICTRTKKINKIKNTKTKTFTSTKLIVEKMSFYWNKTTASVIFRSPAEDSVYVDTTLQICSSLSQFISYIWVCPISGNPMFLNEPD
jgi:hypothetical protein